MKYLIILLFSIILSSCQSYKCFDDDGIYKLATINIETAGYLRSNAVQQICEIIRKDMKK